MIDQGPEPDCSKRFHICRAVAEAHDAICHDGKGRKERGTCDVGGSGKMEGREGRSLAVANVDAKSKRHKKNLGWMYKGREPGGLTTHGKVPGKKPPRPSFSVSVKD